ncbi:Uncharacterised protein [Dermatophilus congolensis]|uniref:Uncharacterized protein n=1 Tax=Dermatophilus congolensis TaxID=1863 RepID=A0A239VCX8_9MICO|nr:Uncharacterised protein [Dermatophilus congolensis]
MDIVTPPRAVTNVALSALAAMLLTAATGITFATVPDKTRAVPHIASTPASAQLTSPPLAAYK